MPPPLDGSLKLTPVWEDGESGGGYLQLSGLSFPICKPEAQREVLIYIQSSQLWLQELGCDVASVQKVLDLSVKWSAPSTG